MIENRGPQLRAVCSAFFVTAILTTTARIYVRARMVKAFGQDDWWMIFAVVMYVWYYSMVVSGVGYGTGQHMYNLEPERAERAMHYWYFCYQGYCMTMIGTKLSIGIFLLRITVEKIHRWIIWAVMGLTVLTGLVFFFVCVFQCAPVTYFWTQVTDPTSGVCLNPDIIIALLYLYSAVSAICDFTFGLLPIALIWNLKMDRRTKIAIIPIISIACIASAAVCVRMAYVKDFKTNDFLYKTVDIAIWSTVEMGLAMTAGSLACLRPLFKAAATRFGFSGPSEASRGPTPLQRNMFNSGGAASSKKLGGSNFSWLTPTNRQSSADTQGIDEEYRMEGVKGLKLRDEESVREDKEREIQRDRREERDRRLGGIAVTKDVSWTVQERSADDSEEDLNGASRKKPSYEWEFGRR